MSEARHRAWRHGIPWAVLLLGCDATEHRFIPADEYEALRNGRGPIEDDAETQDSGVPDPDPLPSTGELDAMAPPNVACSMGRKRCDGSCVDVDSDLEHCGDCGVVCSGVCSSGVCFECGPDDTLCDDACARTASDPEHCGDCETVCGVSQVCEQGRCQPACSDTRTSCNGGCVDTATDSLHCGGCGEACDESDVCSEGACGEACTGGLRLCAGACRDLDTDRAHCGACDDACSPGATCVGGECVAGQEDCTNGLDDDGNELADCEDPACSSQVRCLPEAPAGWSELFTLSQQAATAATELTCREPLGDLVISDLHQQLSAEPPVCGCECSVDAECRVSLWFYEQDDCNSGPWELSGEDRLVSGVCESIFFDREGTNGAVALWPSVELEEMADSVQCTDSSEPPAPPVWGLDAIGCAPTGSAASGCEQGRCVAALGEPVFCVAQQGDVPCPFGFPDRQSWYTGFEDTRSCGTCGCTPRCSDSFLAYTDSNCSEEEESIPAVEMCGPIRPDLSPLFEDASEFETRSFQVAPPTCEPEVEPTGDVVPAGEVTICCEASP